MMDVHVLTVFPRLYRPFLEVGLMARAAEAGKLRLTPWSLRRFTGDDRGQIDDRAYGGERGMVMKPEPYFRGVEHIRATRGEARVLLTAPDGRQLTNEHARALSKSERLIILTGRYEGIDQRVRDRLAEEVWSVGPYVTPGGDLPALTLIASTIRFVPGVVGNDASVARDSYENQTLDTPHYTRPASFRGFDVPEVLRSGDHQNIRAWRNRRAHERTVKHRPNLLDSDERTPPRTFEEGDGRTSSNPQGGPTDEEKN